MKPCEAVQAALLDENVQRVDGFSEHVASCPECSAVASAHRSALRLKGTTPVLARRRSLGETRRRAGMVVGFAIAVGGAMGWWWLEMNPIPTRPIATAPVREEAPQQIVRDTSDADAQWAALTQLQRSTELATAQDFREEEVTLRVFGALPKWVAPRRTSPMRSLGRAASPVVYTQEDVP